jgi:hypothetical protein
MMKDFIRLLTGLLVSLLSSNWENRYGKEESKEENTNRALYKLPLWRKSPCFRTGEGLYGTLSKLWSDNIL